MVNSCMFWKQKMFYREFYKGLYPSTLKLIKGLKDFKSLLLTSPENYIPISSLKS